MTILWENRKSNSRSLHCALLGMTKSRTVAYPLAWAEGDDRMNQLRSPTPALQKANVDKYALVSALAHGHA
jgi:hypothetical protein